MENLGIFDPVLFLPYMNTFTDIKRFHMLSSINFRADIYF